MAELTVLDRVRIARTSEFFEQCVFEGMVTKIAPDSEYPYCVNFDNGYENRYRSRDLELVRPICIICGEDISGNSKECNLGAICSACIP